jgi:hypothetical protein|tara:strand:- start:290 stop:430 length:141 start_codon:yes stop_codon:yes gene_type:complete
MNFGDEINDDNLDVEFQGLGLGGLISKISQFKEKKQEIVKRTGSEI